VFDGDVLVVSPVRPPANGLPTREDAESSARRVAEPVGPAGAQGPGGQLRSRLLARASDERLIERSGLGDERAFQVLIERYRPVLLAYCTRIAGEAGAEDAVQQTFISVWYALGRGCEVQSVRSWLFTIAHRAALQVSAHRSQAEELPVHLAGGRASDEQFELARRAHSALAAVAGLPPRERRALVETTLLGRSGREVASALGVSEVALRQLLFRARARARAAFGAFVPVASLARLPATTGRAVRRALAVNRHSTLDVRTLQAGAPLVRIAPALVSGVLVALPVAAIELTHRPGSRAIAGQTAAQRARSRAGADRRLATPLQARSRRASLALAPQARSRPAPSRHEVPALPGKGERVSSPSSGGREPGQALLGSQSLAGAPPRVPGTSAPATARAPVGGALTPVVSVAEEGLSGVVAGVAPTAAIAPDTVKGASALAAGLGREARAASEAVVGSASQTLGAPGPVALP
jgi:RNA polymerase sigma-70 factor, ECF subfamily